MTKTLRDVLFGDDANAKKTLAKQLGGLVPVPLLVKRALPEEEVFGAAWNLLDIPLDDLLFDTWDKYSEIETAKRSTKAKPGSREQISMTDHTLRSTHEVRIEIQSEGKTIFTVPLELALSLKMDGIVLTVGAGSIIGISPGKAKAQASLKARGQLVHETKLVEVVLPGWARPPDAHI